VAHKRTGYRLSANGRWNNRHMSQSVERLPAQSHSFARRAQRFVEVRFGAELPPGGLATMSLRVAHMGLEFFALMLLAHLLDASAFGVYAVAMTCATILGVPATAGFDRLLVREVAANHANERWSLLRGVFRLGTQVAMFASMLLALALAAVATCVVGEGALRQSLLLAALYMPLVAFARMRQAAIQGLGRVAQGMVTETLVQPAMVLLLASLLFVAVGIPRSGVNAMAVQIASAVVAMIAGIWLLRRVWPAQARSVTPEYHRAQWLGSAAPMMWMLGMNMLINYADTIMVGWLVDEAEAGRYRVASQVAMLVGFPTTAINLAVAPALARAYALGDLPALRLSAARAARWSLIAAVPIAFGLLVGGRWILELFGVGFAAAYQPLLILAAGYVINSFSGAAGYVLIMTRHERLAAGVFTGAAIVNLVTNYLLISRFGMLGAAIATAVGVSLVGMGMWCFVRHHFVKRAVNEVG
jgi:O-antigen/teichoic acid export membrane protein